MVYHKFLCVRINLLQSVTAKSLESILAELMWEIDRQMTHGKSFKLQVKVIYPKYSKYWLSTVTHTIMGYCFHFASFLGWTDFFSAQIALVSTFSQMFIVLGMYNFASNND